MKKILFFLIMILLVVAGCSNSENSSNASNENSNGEDTNIVFSTQGLGTTYNTMTNAFTSAMGEELPEETNVDVQTTSPGGIAAAYIIEQDEADLTLGNSAPANWATTEGIEDREKVDNVTSLLGGFDAPVAVEIFTKDFVEDTGYSTIEEVIENEEPINIALKDTGSFGEMTARKILEELGTSYDEIEEWGGSVTLTDSENVIDSMKDGKADLTIDHTNKEQPNYVELSKNTDIHVGELEESTRESLIDEGYAPQTLPEESFDGAVEEDIETVGSPVTLLAAESMSEETAYKITKSIAENKEGLVESFQAFEDFDPEEACKTENAGAPLHDGAKKYFEENGCEE